MNCKNCGAQLMGMEHACPVCGFPLPQAQAPVPGMMPQPTAPQQMASMPPQMMPADPGQVGLPQGLQEPEESVPEPKKGNKAFAILLIIVALAAIGVGVYLAMTDEKEEQAPKNADSEEVTPSAEPVTTSYAGYLLTIPEGYTISQSEEYGLVAKGSDMIFTIAVDYSNPYSSYKDAYSKAFPDLVPSMITTVGEHEYVAAIASDDTDAKGTAYMTQASDTSTFLGVVVRSDYTSPTMNEFNILETVLTTAVKDTDVQPGSEEDMGKSGMKAYHKDFHRDKFPF